VRFHLGQGRRALPRRRITYQLAADVHWLRAGQVVRPTDVDYNLSGSRAVITRIRRASFPIEATLELLDRTPMTR
jgi:hypothetical protein